MLLRNLDKIYYKSGINNDGLMRYYKRLIQKYNAINRLNRSKENAAIREAVAIEAANPIPRSAEPIFPGPLSYPGTRRKNRKHRKSRKNKK